MDIVLERRGHQLAGVEVKLGASVTSSDFRGLRKLRAAVKQHFTSGVVLYDGETTARLGEGLFAVPIRELWASG